MTYLLLGGDREPKDKKIQELKKKILPSGDVLNFDYEVLDGHKLASDDLKKSLIALPAMAKQRLVIIRRCHKLNPHNKELVLEFAQSKADHAVLVLDSDDMGAKDSFAKKLGRHVKVLDFQEGAGLNVFDMTRAIGMQKPKEALKILTQLTSSGTHPLQIMGGIVWFWGKSRPRLPKEKFNEGLLALQEADLNIKRSRLKPEYALELLVVKLCS